MLGGRLENNSGSVRLLPAIARRALAGTIVVLVAATLAACAGGAPSDEPARETPLALSFPYDLVEGVRFENHRDVAQAVADAYVNVRVYSGAIRHAPSFDGIQQASGLIHEASGVLVDRDGHVVTAAHIARNATFRVEVVTSEGRVAPAQTIAIDNDRELALLRIEPFDGMRPARFGKAALLDEGDPVLAIGTPSRMRGVVSVGAVMDAKLPLRIEYGNYGFDNGVRLKLEIRPGFSGGPLFNGDGEMVGMVASFLLGDTTKPTYISPRVAFAVPAEDIAAFLKMHSTSVGVVH